MSNTYVNIETNTYMDEYIHKQDIVDCINEFINKCINETRGLCYLRRDKQSPNVHFSEPLIRVLRFYRSAASPSPTPSPSSFHPPPPPSATFPSTTPRYCTTLPPLLHPFTPRPLYFPGHPPSGAWFASKAAFLLSSQYVT